MKKVENRVLEIPNSSHRFAYVAFIIRLTLIDGRIVHKTWLAKKMGLYRKTLDLWFSKNQP